jgi:hypothetical protein
MTLSRDPLAVEIKLAALANRRGETAWAGR